MDTDVLIVGAGPTGLMLANQLARRGLCPLIVDRHSGPSLQTRALGVQARTLEIYAQLGIVDRALELGKIGTGANLWASGRRMARIPLGDAGEGVTPYPFILILGQDDNERIMGERLSEWGVSVQWNTELLALEQQPDHVAITLRNPDGTRRMINAAWVAGCDGARSPVRELNGISFPGAPYEHVFFVADVEMTGNMVPDEVNVYLWQEGFHLFFPMRGKDHWRIVGILPRALRERDDVAFDDVVPSVRRQSGGQFDFRTCAWFSTYRIHHRCAARFRQQRCFLLGDAAHIHSPAGAQGMNTGLQDAYNLGWKLALIVKGEADAALLDSYEAERFPIAQQLLQTTDRAFRGAVSDSWIAGLLRTQVFARIVAFAMGRNAMQRFAFRTVSQTGIHYRSNGLSQTTQVLPETAPQAGDRFPWLKLRLRPDGAIEDLFRALSDMQFHLLVFGSPERRNDWPLDSDLLRVHMIAADTVNSAELDRAHIPSPSFYLMRPDGYIGLCGLQPEPDAFGRYLQEHLHLLNAAVTRVS
jgi:2-polyprenyl-6-methoxyphenol hydroxylase-like FAD-dependent oxidoreductase